MADAPLLEIRGMTKGFGSQRVLEQLDFSVASGERRGVIGPNGAGKTTLINLISGRVRPDQGRIVFGGRDITPLPPFRRARLGIGRSFQILSLFEQETVRDTLHAAVRRRHGLGMAVLRRVASMRAVDAECRALAREFGLGDVVNRLVHTLPYGLQRLLDVALVIALDPSLLVLDEPAAGLSAAETRDLVSLLERKIGSRALVLIEHDMDVVFGLADTVTVLDYGRIVMQGAPSEVRTHPVVREIYLGTTA